MITYTVSEDMALFKTSRNAEAYVLVAINVLPELLLMITAVAFLAIMFATCVAVSHTSGSVSALEQRLTPCELHVFVLPSAFPELVPSKTCRMLVCASFRLRRRCKTTEALLDMPSKQHIVVPPTERVIGSTVTCDIV